ncbi:nitrate- and nitrite sensing domain-containing protein [Streptomyces sp. NPDC002574]|uniref:sensor histidine kinase n=1 Tax=Streptomyces sp. NPDC002574 TaxID=3364652 RepID=UPI0036B5567A
MTPQRGRRAHAGLPADERPQRTSLPGLRPRTVRAKIVCLLMVPVVSLMALWAFAAVTTAQDISRQFRAQRVAETIREPVVTTITALEAERRAAGHYMADPRDVTAAELKRRSSATGHAVGKLRLGKDHTVADGTGLPDEVADRVRAFVGAVDGLDALRPGGTAPRAEWGRVYQAYTDAIADAFAIAAVIADSPQSRVALDIGRAAEQLACEDALLSTAALDHDLPTARYGDVSGAVRARRFLLATAVPGLTGDTRRAWDRLSGSEEYADLAVVEDAVLAAGPGKAAADAAPAAAWDRTAGRVATGLAAIAVGTAPSQEPVLHSLLSRSGVAVLLGLIAVVASLLISVRIGRGLVVELVELRNTAFDLARRKLPRAMRRLRAGEPIDLEAEAPLGRHGSDEIGQVAEALATVQRSALRAAAERAELLSGVSGVFVNLARRSQVLVHRQLALLDTMERRTEDPEELEDLFRLDHLSTRMRRHAEGLIILSGAAPGRAWRKPVPLANVVRAAVAEVEDYARVEVRRLPRTAVVGAAVADLTHLVAELVENATQFSPPHTKVRVYGEQVGNGFVLEVEDRGLGMGAEAMAEANRRIGQSQALDLFDSDRLGLFVVSRLAARHDVKVALRPSPYGGTTAVVLLPSALLETGAQEADAIKALGTRIAAPTVQGNGTLAEEPVPAVAASSRDSDDRPPRGAVPRPVPERERAPAPTGPTAPAPAPVPVAAAPSPSSAQAPAPAESTPAGDGPLPRRVRRASLAPQLLERPAAEDASATGPVREAPERSPEQARATLAAYRSGWIRGGGTQPREADGDTERAARRPLRAAPPPERDPDDARGHGGPRTAPENGDTDTGRTAGRAPREGEHG